MREGEGGVRTQRAPREKGVFERDRRGMCVNKMITEWRGKGRGMKRNKGRWRGLVRYPHPPSRALLTFNTPPASGHVSTRPTSPRRMDHSQLRG
jgi:hypothetical protein